MTPHVIRAWEKRYGAVRPKRTETNRRLYSDADVERLNLLKEAAAAGNTIGQIASLESTALLELSGDKDPLSSPSKSRTYAGYESLSPADHLESCVAAITRFDAEALETALNRAAIELHRMTLLDTVVAPFLQEIGRLWSDGGLKIYQEHTASSAIRTFLGDLLRFSEIQTNAKAVVFGTPAGQLHELGALMAAVGAASEGWRATYIGANLPSEEIAGAAARVRATAVCLSLVFPADDPKTVFEIKRLRLNLPAGTHLIIGGQAADAYGKHLRAFDARIVDTIPKFITILKALG